RVVGAAALLRFYVAYVVGLPLVAFLLMVVHFWRLRKDGFSGGLRLGMATEAQDGIAARERVVARRREVEAPSTVRDDSDDEMIVSFPEFVFKEFIASVAMTVFLVLVSIWLQAPLLWKANPG